MVDASEIPAARSLESIRSILDLAWSVVGPMTYAFGETMALIYSPTIDVSAARLSRILSPPEQYMRQGIIFPLLAVFLVLPASVPAQEAPPALANSPSIVQWTRIEGSMSELLSQGYRLITVSQVTTTPPVQDIITSFYLSRGTDLVRCEEGVRLVSEKYWVTTCSKLAKPYEITEP